MYWGVLIMRFAVKYTTIMICETIKSLCHLWLMYYDDDKRRYVYVAAECGIKEYPADYGDDIGRALEPQENETNTNRTKNINARNVINQSRKNGANNLPIMRKISFAVKNAPLIIIISFAAADIA